MSWWRLSFEGWGIFAILGGYVAWREWLHRRWRKR